jgi:hypothetical protein
MSNVRTRLEALEAGKKKQRGLLGLAERMRRLMDFVGPRPHHEPEPDSILARVREQEQRNAEMAR